MIVVSNRVQPPGDASATVGGLAMALAAPGTQRGLVRLERQTIEEHTGQLSVQRIGGVTVATIDLEPQDLDEYYNGYANKTLAAVPLPR